MKQYIASLVILLFAAGNSFCQSSYEYTMAIQRKVSSLNAFMNDTYKDTILLRRIETGVLYIESDKLYGSTERKLYKGNKYIIDAFTDSRVKDFTLKIYKENSSSTWDLIETVNNNSSTTTNTDLIGDYELSTIIPDSDEYYKFEISSPSRNNVTSRYGIMLWSRDVSTQSTTTTTDNGNGSSGKSGKKTYSIDNYSIADYNTTTGKYDFGEDTAYSCLFIINADRTVLTRQESSGSTTTFYIETTDDTDSRWLIYGIRSKKGNKYKFMVPKDGKEYIRAIIDDGNTNNPLKDYHILAQWTDSD